jgi:transposase-like protein
MNIIEISEKFPTELDAIKHFETIRFGDRNRCAYCDSVKLSIRSKRDNRFKCYDCKKSTFVTVNTSLHSTNMDLKKWMYAFSIITDAKKGLSALQLQRNLSISYPTALNMYHKIRGLMTIENNAIQLDGIVEMDETYVGGKPRKFNNGTTEKFEPTVIPELDKRISELKEVGVSFKRKRGNPAHPAENPKRGRGTSKIPVIGMVERNGNVVAEVSQNVTAYQIRKMVEKYVDTDDSVLITDTYKGYAKMDAIIENVKIDHHKLYSYKGINTNSIESFWAIIKRQIIGQHHQVSLKHLPKYVAEAVFKYNNRTIDDMFATLIKNSMISTTTGEIPNSL